MKLFFCVLLVVFTGLETNGFQIPFGSVLKTIHSSNKCFRSIKYHASSFFFKQARGVSVNSKYILDAFDPEEDELIDQLSNENLLRIVKGEIPDQQVNLLAWKCLGYELVDGEWKADKVFPNWKAKYPSPPDLIGVLRNYTKSIDLPAQKANQQLVASIPLQFKQGIKEHLRPLGFTGFMLAELTPNKTRRAQVVNWLLFYREAVHGKSLEQLRAEQAARAAAEKPPDVVGPNSIQASGSGSLESSYVAAIIIALIASTCWLCPDCHN